MNWPGHGSYLWSYSIFEHVHQLLSEYNPQIQLKASNGELTVGIRTTATSKLWDTMYIWL